VITYALGHLVEIDDGEFTGKKWVLDELPLIPKKFSYRIMNGKKDQFRVIKNLLKSAGEVYVFTDAGREGELIARLILMLAGYKGKAKRFWTSEALTMDVVKRELSRMKDLSEYDSLYYSALARQHADWIVGINLTRLATLKMKSLPVDGSGLVWSVGRVQTPVLKLVVDREMEIRNFKPEEYYVVLAEFEKDGIKYVGRWVRDWKNADEEEKEKSSDLDEENENQDGKKGKKQKRLTKEESASIVEQVAKEKKSRVVVAEKVLKKEPPPLLYSLTTLQKDANRIYGFSLKKTHDVAQRLYEKYKCISYPRTDACHLGDDARSLVKSVLKKLGKGDLVASVDKVGKRVFDSSKLTDHHALIPLDKLPLNASEDEKKLYDLILRRFLCVFMGDCKYYQVKVVTAVRDHNFLTVGRQVVDPGWRKAYDGISLYEEKEGKVLPPLKKGDVVNKLGQKMERKLTQPPPRYTEALLVAKMEKLNLGRPSTRDGIVETLIKRGYVVKQGRVLFPTEKTFALISVFENNPVSSPEMTGEWETKLEEIYVKRKHYKGYLSFVSEIKDFVIKVVNDLKHEKVTYRKLPFSLPSPSSSSSGSKALGSSRRRESSKATKRSSKAKSRGGLKSVFAGLENDVSSSKSWGSRSGKTKFSLKSTYNCGSGKKAFES
jgi:DNA topoisomerase-3